MARALARNQGGSKRKENAAQAASLIKPARQSISHLKMAVYGKNGAGKTHFAGSSDLKTLIIDCNEKGFETLRNRPNVDVFEVEAWEQVDWIFWHLRTNDTPYEVLAIDTVTMLASLCMKHILNEDYERDNSIDPKMPDRRHWGKLAILLGDEFIRWRNLKKHVLFLAQERTNTTEEDENGAGSLVEVVPSLSKAPLNALMSAVGTIGRIYTRQTIKEEVVQKGTKKFKKKVTQTERRMLLAPDNKYAGKTRIQGLPRVVVNPTLSEILAIREKLGELPPGEVMHGREI